MELWKHHCLGSQTFLGGLLWRGPPDVLGGLLRRGPPNYSKGSICLELHKGSNQGPPFASSSFADLFFRTALDKTFVGLFGSSLWGLPSLGAFGITFSRNTLDKSFVGLFGASLWASLQVQDYRGLHFKRV